MPLWRGRPARPRVRVAPGVAVAVISPVERDSRRRSRPPPAPPGAPRALHPQPKSSSPPLLPLQPGSGRREAPGGAANGGNESDPTSVKTGPAAPAGVRAGDPPRPRPSPRRHPLTDVKGPQDFFSARVGVGGARGVGVRDARALVAADGRASRAPPRRLAPFVFEVLLETFPPPQTQPQRRPAPRKGLPSPRPSPAPAPPPGLDASMGTCASTPLPLACAEGGAREAPVSPSSGDALPACGLAPAAAVERWLALPLEELDDAPAVAAVIAVRGGGARRVGPPASGPLPRAQDLTPAGRPRAAPRAPSRCPAPPPRRRRGAPTPPRARPGGRRPGARRPGPPARRRRAASPRTVSPSIG
jgi:hypothetical protein